MSADGRPGPTFEGAGAEQTESSATDGAANAQPPRSAAIRGERIQPNRFRNIYADYYEFAPSACLILAEDGNIVEVNRAGSALLGLPREALVNVPFERHVASEERTVLNRNLAAMMNGNPHPVWEQSLLRGDGSRFAAQLDGARLARNGQSRFSLVLSDITARKQAEAALREQEEFFRLIAEKLGDLVAVLDLDGRRIYNSPSYRHLFGDGRDLRGTDSFAEIHEEDRPRIRQAFAETVRTGIGRRGDYRFVLSDGSVRLMESMGDVITDADGRVLRVVVVSRDVTERKHAETQLRIAATAFETHVAMIVTDGAGVIQKANRAFSELTGYAAEEVIGRTPKLLNSGRHDAAFYARMWDGIRRDGAWQGEIWNRRKNGEVYPQWLTITAVPDGGDATAHHYVATMTDISERKAAEENIRHQALYDDLTQLPNRRLLLDRLKWALTACARNRRRGALMMIDLDRFKDLNDTLGHDHGDLLLQQVAQRLTGCIREVDTAARLGGDEFVVMLSDLGEDAVVARRLAETVGRKILDTLNGSYDLFGKLYHGTPSIGITMFAHRHTGVEELLKQADRAMYRAKAAGRNALRFHEP